MSKSCCAMAQEVTHMNEDTWLRKAAAIVHYLLQKVKSDSVVLNIYAAAGVVDDEKLRSTRSHFKVSSLLHSLLERCGASRFSQLLFPRSPSPRVIVAAYVHAQRILSSAAHGPRRITHHSLFSKAPFCAPLP